MKELSRLPAIAVKKWKLLILLLNDRNRWVPNPKTYKAAQNKADEANYVTFETFGEKLRGYQQNLRDDKAGVDEWN